MARPTPRLDLVLVAPGDPAVAERAAEARFQAWRRGEGLLDVKPRALRIDRPGQPVLYANPSGGFHVRCGHCGAGVAQRFAPFGHTPCRCGRRLPFDELHIAPPAAIGAAALVLVDVERAVWNDPLGWPVVLQRR